MNEKTILRNRLLLWREENDNLERVLSETLAENQKLKLTMAEFNDPSQLEAYKIRCSEDEKYDRWFQIGQKWEQDSSLETWFPFTAQELKILKEENKELKERIFKLELAVSLYIGIK